MLAALAMQRDSRPSGELESVRYWLRKWKRWRRNWAPDLGVAMMNYSRRTRGTIDSYAEPEDYDDRIEGWIVQAIESAIAEDLSRDEAHAINVRYMNEQGSEVFRSRRFSKEEIRALADAGERALIPALRRRHVSL